MNEFPVLVGYQLENFAFCVYITPWVTREKKKHVKSNEIVFGHYHGIKIRVQLRS